jgi:hypothetical protein
LALYQDIDVVATRVLNNSWDPVGDGTGALDHTSNPWHEYGAHLPNNHLAQAAPVIPDWVRMIGERTYARPSSAFASTARGAELALAKKHALYPRAAEDWTLRSAWLAQMVSSMITSLTLVVYVVCAAACHNTMPRVAGARVVNNLVSLDDDTAALVDAVYRRRAAGQPSDAALVDPQPTAMFGELWLRTSAAVSALGVRLDTQYPDRSAVRVGGAQGSDLLHGARIFQVLQNERQRRSGAGAEAPVLAVDLSLVAENELHADSAAVAALFHTTCAIELLVASLARIAIP